MEEPSRKDIAASLAQKDPTWFRQTQDRGLKSAAYRKNQVEDSPTPAVTSRTMQLPGMASQREPSKSPTPETRAARTASPAQGRDQAEFDRYKRGSTPDIAALRKSMIVPPSQLQPTSQDSPNTRPLSMISTSNTDVSLGLDRSFSILSSDRPASPTKGLGGFVESAMMKRSDSVKRWSVKADTGLRRGDSVAGGRQTAPLHNRGLSRDINIARDASPSSPLTSSRQETDQIQVVSQDIELGSLKNNAKQGKDISQHRGNSVDVVSPDVEIPERTSARSQTPQDDSTLARSPSKTMDPRRWSPTKSTWLESALQSKPDPPKLQPLKEDQPKWKVDLQRSKSRASRDVSPDKAGERDENSLNIWNASSPVEEHSKTSNELSSRPPPAKQQRERHVSGSKPDNLKMLNTKTPEKLISPEEPSAAKSSTNHSKPVVTATEAKENDKDVPTVAKDERKPPVVKPKPQTPPKTDFRATLKSRPPTSTSSTDAEPEFKAMFGKLKRATTQNYVAPDELKTNILSGKAALNASAGPQKAKPVDDFKESLLAKKEEMKTSGNKFGSNAELQNKQVPPLPEALARRKTLSKASAPNLRTITSPPISAKPELQQVASGRGTENLAKSTPVENITSAEPKDESAKSPFLKSEVPSKPPPLSQRKPSDSTPKTNVLERSFSEETLPKQRGINARSELKTRTTPLPDNNTSTNPKMEPVVKSLSSPSPSVTNDGGLHAGSKLASRLNPNLAAMLSRSNSPKPMPSTTVVSEQISSSNALTKTRSTTQDDNTDSLTHMTKGRAKGPKRRAPKADAHTTEVARLPAAKFRPTNIPGDIRSNTARQVDLKKPDSNIAAMPSPKTSISEAKPTVKPKQSTTIPAPQPRDSNAKAQGVKDSENEMSRTGSVRQKPAIASKSPELRRVSNSQNVEQRSSSSPKTSLSTSPKASPTPPPKPNLQEAFTTPSKSLATSKVLVVKEVSPKVMGSNQNATDKLKDKAAVAPSPKPSKLQGLGLGVQTPSPAAKAIAKPQILTPPPEHSASNGNKVSLQHIKDKIEDYVGVLDKGQTKADFDAQQFLVSAKDGPAKVKRQQYTVHEISGAGKKDAMPPQQEHILYEESMYLITHNFVNSTNTNASEVYLWCGDRISDAAVEDAQLFCRREAREHNTKLEVVKQGKESSNLIEALGGILITRRSKSSSFYMLCGRRHLGQIVFDEVDMDPSNLCPGFVYLISAQFGKLYLWKGKGASADEIGSAKLIGMDLGLTGEIEEIDEGAESNDFWQCLNAGKPAHWSTDWHQRANTNGYPTVLYRIEHERPGVLGSLWALKRATSPAKGQPPKAMCQKVEPFSQHDLEAASIHVLDSYRNLYALINNQCMSKGSELVTTMYLVQDFAMLSPSIQDRPLLPRCYVVIGEPTPDVKACFRKWNVVDGYTLAGKDSLCVTLEEAMEALGL